MTEIQFNTCRKAATICQTQWLNAETLVLYCLDSDHLYHFYQGSVIYHCSSSSTKCGLSNELLVLGRSAFLDQDSYMKVGLIRNYLWRVASSSGKDWLKKGKCHFLRLGGSSIMGIFKKTQEAIWTEETAWKWMKWVRVGKCPVYFSLLVTPGAGITNWS